MQVYIDREAPKLWRKICSETTVEVSLLAENWKIFLAGLIFQYIHGMAAHGVHYIHRPGPLLQDSGYIFLPELGQDKSYISETLFSFMFGSFVLWTLHPFLFQSKRIYTVRIWCRVFIYLVVCVNMAGWSELNECLLIEIINRLTLYEDLAAFGSVCTSWHSVALMERPRFISKLTPWLMLPPEHPTTGRVDFNSLSENMTCQVVLPEAELGDNRCFSSRGWLLTISKFWTMTLLHPFSRRQIELPCMKTLKNWRHPPCHLNFISKFVLSSDPCNTSDFIVMVLYEPKGELAYCKAGEGDKSWIPIETCGFYDIHDVIYYNGLCYVIKKGSGRIMSYDIRNHIAKEVAQMTSDIILKYPQSQCLYLVESAGRLLVVSRVGEYDFMMSMRHTRRFQVFEVDLTSNTWTETKNLGNRAVFVGINSSFSIDDATHCKSNCIYFIDDYCDIWGYLSRGRDIGIYNLQDGSIEPRLTDYSKSFNSPMWVQVFNPVSPLFRKI